MNLPKFNRTFGKVMKIVGIILIAIPLICAGNWKLNRLEFDVEESKKDINTLTNNDQTLDDRVTEVEKDFLVLLETTRINQKQIMQSLERIESKTEALNQGYIELIKKAKW